MSTVLSCDLDLAEFLARATARPRREAVIWTQQRLIAHLYDEETERLRPFAKTTKKRPKRKALPDNYTFTDRQLQIATDALNRTEGTK